MDNFNFDEKNHIYTLNREVIPSVSEIIRPIYQNVYGNISQRRLDVASDRGTRVHRAIEFWNKYNFVGVDEDCTGYFEAYQKFREEHPTWKLLSSELRTYNKELLYGMTIDEVYKTENGILISDIKTTCKSHLNAWSVQLAGYKLGYESQFEKVEDTIILHLSKNGKYKLFNFNPNTDVFLACLKIYNFNKN